MAFSSLRNFIDHLEKDGRLVRVGEPVSPNLEMTEIQTRLLAEGGSGFRSSPDAATPAPRPGPAGRRVRAGR